MNEWMYGFEWIVLPDDMFLHQKWFGIESMKCLSLSRWTNKCNHIHAGSIGASFPIEYVITSNGKQKFAKRLLNPHFMEKEQNLDTHFIYYSGDRTL